MLSGVETILLLQNPAGGRGSLRRVLEQSGWRVQHAMESIEALEMVRGGRVDLVLLHMPALETIDMDLPNVMRQVCVDTYLPVMIMAEDPAQQQRCLLLDSGADDVVSEAMHLPELTARIRSLLRIKRLHDCLAQSRQSLQHSLRRERRLLEKLRRDNAHLQDLASTDPLTRVRNVRSFDCVLEQEFKVARRYNHPLSLLMLDVDHFKQVNDTHGHPSGDCVLKELAAILRRNVRDADAVARTGGEEFSIVLPRSDRQQAWRMARRIRDEVSANQFVVYGRRIHVTVSIGTASYPCDAEITSPQMLVYFADKALLRAKNSGRDRAVAFHDLDVALRRQLRLEHAAMEGDPDLPTSAMPEPVPLEND